MSIFLSMAVFALVSSITPGPVNIVALGSGAQYGWRASLRHVTGASFGFTLLLLMIGLGLHELLSRWPYLMQSIQWAGVAFLLFMSGRLVTDDGKLASGESQAAPSLSYGAAMQWLNPKAWLAAVSGMGAYTGNGDPMLIWQFAVIYFVICYGSIFCWAYAGTCLRQFLGEPKRMRLFNRLMALLLFWSAVYLIAA